MMRIATVLAIVLTINTSVADGTVVVLTFSDGYIAHKTIAGILNGLWFNATFFLNTINIGFIDGWMNVFDINGLVASGFEIGGHTLNHYDLTKQDSVTVTEQICRDRARLIANRWIPKSFHYPYGNSNDMVKNVVKECGYSGAIVNGNGTSIRFIEDDYEIPMYIANDDVSFQQLVNEVAISKGLIVFNFHNVPIDINSPFIRFLDWLKVKRDSGEVIVKSLDQIVQGAYYNIPNEFANTPPTPTPDPDALLKIYIGSGCIGLLVLLVMYVIITTQIKRRTKIKFLC